MDSRKEKNERRTFLFTHRFKSLSYTNALSSPSLALIGALPLAPAAAPAAAAGASSFFDPQSRPSHPLDAAGFVSNVREGGTSVGQSVRLTLGQKLWKIVDEPFGFSSLSSFELFESSTPELVRLAAGFGVFEFPNPRSSSSSSSLSRPPPEAGFGSFDSCGLCKSTVSPPPSYVDPQSEGCLCCRGCSYDSRVCVSASVVADAPAPPPHHGPSFDWLTVLESTYVSEGFGWPYGVEALEAAS
jgi:hypothetical protein